MASTRKLLTIFAADIADYTKFMSEDEASTLSQLSSLRELALEVFSKKGGKVANTAGDSILAVFDSPLHACEAAIEIQNLHDAYNQNLSVNKQMRFRIGINLGDVQIQPNGDVLGHGVNVAARLEQLSVPGGFCLSESVFNQVKHNLDLNFSKVGEHFVKNIDEPIRVYSVGSTNGGRSFHFRKTLARLTKSAGLQVFLVVSVAILLSTTVYTQLLQPESKFVPSDLDEFLATDPTPEELLSRFDLVTRGEFQNSKYFIVRTWGAELNQLERMAEILGGHIVSINSPEENQYLYELSLEDGGHWMTEIEQYVGPMIGLVQRPGSVEPAGGWEWLNGEPVTYLNWESNGPDNSNGNQSISQFRNSYGHRPWPYWDDIDHPKNSVIFEVPVN